MIAPDLDQARKFLDLLDPDVEAFTFQTFDDSELKRGHLAKVLHGSLDELAPQLIALQKAGAGVFVTVNETDGQGRRAENIKRARALFIDLDGAPVQPVLTCPLEPHVVIESSPGRYHAYWMAHRLPLDRFGQVQKAIIKRFGGDKAVHDLPRVMRVPGFAHQKGEPFITRLAQVNERLPYEADDICREFYRQEEDNAKPNGHDQDPFDLDGLRKALTGETPHAWHAAMLSMVAHLVSKGAEDWFILDWALQYRWQGYSQDETRRDVQGMIDGARAKGWGQQQQQATPKELIMLDDCALDTDVFWAVEDILPRCTMMMIYARGGSGKTYLGNSLALGAGTGQWFDHTAEHGAVLICAFERPDDTEDRLAALRDLYGFHDLPVALLKLAGEPLDKARADLIISRTKELAERTGLAVRIIEIDTVSAALGGAREDDEGLGRLRSEGERIHAETGSLVVWIHHEGKGDHMGPRGHLVLADACSVWWHVEEREDGTRVVHVSKANRGPDHVPLFAFRLVPFEAGKDRRGKSIQLCAVQLTDLEPALASPVRKRFGQAADTAPAPLGKRQKLMLRLLRKLSDKHPNGVELALLRSHFLMEANAERKQDGKPEFSPDHARVTFNQTLGSLRERGLIEGPDDALQLNE